MEDLAEGKEFARFVGAVGQSVGDLWEGGVLEAHDKADDVMGREIFVSGCFSLMSTSSLEEGLGH